MHLDTGYDLAQTRTLLRTRDLHRPTASKGQKTPIQPPRRWHAARPQFSDCIDACSCPYTILCHHLVLVSALVKG